MPERGIRWIDLAALCFWICPGPAPRLAQAQQRRAPVQALSDASTSDALTKMASQAGVIFAGHVISIQRNDSAGYVDVVFAIDQAISGCPAAGMYGVREWAGLWAGHGPRYVVGRRYLMLLHPPGPAGISTPVGGLDGAIPLVAAGAGPVMDTNGNVPADTGAGALSGLNVDLRWVQARAIRAQATTEAKAHNALSIAVGRPIAAPSAAVGNSTTATLEQVVAVLRGGTSGAR